MSKGATISFGLLAIVLSVFLYMLLGNIGFPDGHLTEADLALRLLYKAGILLNSFFALCFLYAGIRSIPDGYTVLLKYAFLLSGAAILLLYFCLSHFLENGQGG